MENSELSNKINQLSQSECVEFLNDCDVYAEKIGNGNGLGEDISSYVTLFKGKAEIDKEDILSNVENHLLHIGGRPKDRG